MAKEVLHHINSLSEVSPEELPESSRFLLEIKFSELSKHHLETQRYWTLAVVAALKANALEQARGAIERILDVTFMSDATSLACYWPFNWPLANSNRYQRGRATSRMPGSTALFATLLW